MTKEKKTVWGWAMYDWANSAFATTVMAGFFPIFFKKYCMTGKALNIAVMNQSYNFFIYIDYRTA